MKKPTSTPKTPDETMDFIHGRPAKGVGAQALENARKAFATVRGRPSKGAKPDGSSAKSLRLPNVTWVDVAAAAQKRKMSVHRFLRTIVAEHLYTTSWAERIAESEARKAAATTPSKLRGKSRKPRSEA